MDYQEFNRKILEYYIVNSTSVFCSLTIDKEIIETIIPLNSITEFVELKSSWQQLLLRVNEIPQYFGLIAVQCYAASIMHDDGENAAFNYQVRLMNILDIKDQNQLQKLFVGNLAGKPIQERIWQDAKNHLYINHHLLIDIPQVARYAGRYVQFPKSQTLLNTEDLKHFTSFFAEELGVNEEVSFEYFTARLKANLKNIKLTNRAKTLMEENNKVEKCFYQIFNYYNLWDGEICEITNRKRTKEIKFAFLPDFDHKKEKFILVFENCSPKFFEAKSNSINILDLASDSLEKINRYRFKKNNILIFNESGYYPDEYENARFLFNHISGFILIHRSCEAEYQYLENNNSGKFPIAEEYFLFKVDHNSPLVDSPLKQYYQLPFPISLRGGIKLNRFNEYLESYGPEILCNNNFRVLFENQKCYYDPQKAKCGRYKIRIDNLRDFEFIINQKQNFSNVISSKKSGWDLEKYSISIQQDIEGIFLTNNKQNIVRVWIDANLKNNRTLYEGDNILIKAINNSLQ
jgi:hypothetical protein